MRKQLITLLILVHIFTNVTAQFERSFFGKRTTISVDGSIRATLLYNFITRDKASESEYENDNKLGYHAADRNDNPKTRFLGGGYHITLTHYLKNKNIGLAFEFGHIFQSTKTYNKEHIYSHDVQYDEDNLNYHLISIYREHLDIQSFRLMPKVEWSKNSTILPIGFSMYAGLGLQITSIIPGKYSVYNQYGSTYFGDTYYKEAQFDPQGLRNFNHMLAEIGIKIKMPITKFMTFDITSTARIPLLSINQLNEMDSYTSDKKASYEQKLIDSNYDGMYASLKKAAVFNLLDVRFGMTFFLF